MLEFRWQSTGRLVETVLFACEWPQRRLCLTLLVVDPVNDGVGFAFSVCCHAGGRGAGQAVWTETCLIFHSALGEASYVGDIIQLLIQIDLNQISLKSTKTEKD